jgi:peptidoglycan/LPS O-acetylase OafA/YrhL
MTPAHKRSGYFPALDGLRLLASFNIVLMHLDSSWCLGTVHNWPIIGVLVRGPGFNASLFFVLGGFIFFNQLAPKVDSFRVLPFLKSRFKKLYPLHLFTLLLMVFVVWFRLQYEGDIWFLLKSAGMHLSLLWAFDPLHWLSLNEPSWALTPFFIAYATLGFLLKPLVQEKRLGVLWGILFATLVPTLVFGVVYTFVAMVPNAYAQFHVFPLLRVFEFYFGMVLARIFQLSSPSPISKASPWLQDLAVVAGIVAAWVIVHLKWKHGIFLSWFGPHFLSLVVYGWIVWFLARGTGFMARIFSNRIVAAVGRSSFYPYLWHLPLIALTVIISKALGFKGFFYLWWQPVLFLVVLYGLSALHLKRKGKKS